MSDELDIVVICSGNRFRSPLAEAVLRRAAEGLRVRVGSFGTMHLPPGPAMPEALELARGYGLDLGSHRSRPLEGADLSGADLVIGFEPIHASTAVVDARAPRDKTFLLTELVDALERSTPAQGDDVVERAREAVRNADQARNEAASAPREIADPIGGSSAVYQSTAEEVHRLTSRLADLLFA